MVAMILREFLAGNGSWRFASGRSGSRRSVSRLLSAASLANGSDIGFATNSGHDSSNELGRNRGRVGSILNIASTRGWSIPIVGQDRGDSTAALLHHLFGAGPSLSLRDPSDDAVAVVHPIFEHILTQVVRKDLKQHRLARDVANVGTIFAHLVLPVSELLGNPIHGGDLREVLEISAATELNELVSALKLHKEGSPEFEAIAIHTVSKLDSLIINCLADSL